MLGKSVKVGMKVRVSSTATKAIEAACLKLKRTSLLGVCKTAVDPCCGCVIVEFKVPLLTRDRFYTDGKVGHLDEVKPIYMHEINVKAKGAKSPRGFSIGTRVKVTKAYDAARVGMVGTVISTPARLSHSEYGIKLDTLTFSRGGHSLGGLLKGDAGAQGQWVPGENLEKVSEAEPPAPPKPYALSVGPGNHIKVNFTLREKTKLSGDERLINEGVQFYGWLTVTMDGSMVRRVVTAPFGSRQWLCLDAEDTRISNITPFEL